MTSILLLNHGRVALVDDEDFDLSQFNWSCSLDKGRLYARRNSRSSSGKVKRFLLHRVIFSRVLGRELKAHECVDHINRDTLDNRRQNLRLATKKQNSRNRGLSRNNTSGYKGVSFNKRDKVYAAKIRVDNKLINLGNYKNILDAAKAYNEAATKYFGEFASLNIL